MVDPTFRWTKDFNGATSWTESLLKGFPILATTPALTTDFALLLWVARSGRCPAPPPHVAARKMKPPKHIPALRKPSISCGVMGALTCSLRLGEVFPHLIGNFTPKYPPPPCGLGVQPKSGPSSPADCVSPRQPGGGGVQNIPSQVKHFDSRKKLANSLPSARSQGLGFRV